VLNLKQLIKDTKELSNESEYLDLVQDIRIECANFGSALSVKVAKPGGPGVGNAYIKLSEVHEAETARSALALRRFLGHFVLAWFHPEQMYDDEDFRETWELPA
jgi:hypothetical protein